MNAYAINADYRSPADSESLRARFYVPAVLLMRSIEDTSLEDWRKVHRIDAEGYFLGCKYAIAAMKQSGGGSIVNMLSVAAPTGIPIVYNCNSIHPDCILTPMTLGYLGSDVERL